MARPKGSKNKEKADKPVKLLTPGAAPSVKRGRPKGTLNTASKEAPSSSFQDQVKVVLSHLLELFKASLLDAFRQYLESRIKTSTCASVDEFTDKFKHTMTIHGMSKDTLLEALTPVELEYLQQSAQVAEKKVHMEALVNETQMLKAKMAAEQARVDSIMHQNVLASQPAPVQAAPVQPAPVQPAPVQPAPVQAASVQAVLELVPREPKEVKPDQVSVFDSLDLI